MGNQCSAASASDTSRMRRTGVQAEESSRRAAGPVPNETPLAVTSPAGFPAAGVALITLCAFALYARMPSAFPSWDTLHYAAYTAAGAPGALVSAHHPLGTLLAYSVYRVGRAFGQDHDALRMLQLTSAACAALTLGGLYAVLRCAGARVA